MQDWLLKSLNITQAESTRVFLLLAMGFLTGIFLATLDVGATALFLQQFNESEDLPLAILLSGIVGLVATTIYNQFQTRLKFKHLGLGTLVLMIITLGIIGIGLQKWENTRDLYFAGFIVVVPFNFLVMLLFWGSFNRMFDVRSAKRIIGSIDTGQLLASIVALFSIPFILQIENISEKELLIISLVSLTGILVVFWIIGRNNLKHIPERTAKINYSGLFRNRYMLLMASFVIISMIAVNFIDYSFLTVTTMQFSENEVATFLSLFEATVVIFSFLFQTFVTDRVISVYGLKTALLVNPILIIVLTTSAFLAGSFFGFTGNDSTLIYFFMAIAMSKLFVDSLKDALDGPSFKLYFLPIEKSIRFDVQTKIEGVVTAMASLLAGALIILINNVEAFELLHITIFTIPLLGIWYFITTRMYTGYKDTLQSTLVKNQSISTTRTSREYSVEKLLQREVNNDEEAKVLYGLQLMEKLEPALFENSILKLSNSSFKKVKAFAVQKMREYDISEFPKDTVGQLARNAVDYSSDSEILSVPPERLLKLSKSVKSEDRILAAKLLKSLVDGKNIFILLELLRDINPKVKYEAIVTARRVKKPETWPVLIDLLDSIVFSHSAAAALTEAGDLVLPVLDAAFYRSGQSPQVMYKIIQIIGRIGGAKARELLWKKIDYPDKKIVKQILLIYRYMNYQVNEDQTKKIVNLLEMEIGKCIWNLAALLEIPKEDSAYDYLREAVKEEIAGNFDHIYMLLSLIYDQQSVQLVRENIDSGTNEGIAFALELLDIFISKELKPKLFPLLDDISVEQKLKQLQIYFPREQYNTIQTLNYILNKDYNQVNRWTKACAIHLIAFLPEFHVSKGLIAQLFNPDKLLQEAAAWVIFNKNKELYEQIEKRIPEETRKFLRTSIESNQLQEGLEDGFFLRLEMVMFLKRVPVLRQIKGNILCDLVEGMSNLILENGESIDIQKDGDDEKIYIIADGDARLALNNADDLTLSEGDIVGSLFSSDIFDKAVMLHVEKRAVIFTLSINEFYHVMANHHELAQDFLASVHNTTIEQDNRIKN